MTYAFRIRFRIPVGQSIEDEGSELLLSDNAGRRVSVKPLEDDVTIKQAREFVLRGVGYVTAEDAHEDGLRWVDALALGFVAELLPADFGMRVPQGGFFTAALDEMSAKQGVAFFNDSAGLIVVPEEPEPHFISVGATATAIRNSNATVAAITDVYDSGVRTNERTMLAYELFTAAESMPPGNFDARFLMLVFSIEALVEQGRRPAPQLAVIDRLRGCLDSMDDLDASDVQPMRDALGQMKRESIGSAGRRLVATVGSPPYLDGRSAEQFFAECYTGRSNLVHGNVERPSTEVVRSMIGPLLWLVRDLIRRSAGIDWSHPRDQAEAGDLS